MRVRLRLDPETARGWHTALVEQLEARSGTSVEIERRPARGSRLPANAERLFRFESAIHGRTANEWAARPAQGLPERCLRPEAPDVAIDLDAAPTSPGTWRLLFDGEPGDAALFASLAGGRNPVAELRDGERVIAAGRLGTDSPGNLRVTFEEALARTVTLVAAAVAGAPADRPLSDQDARPPLARTLTATDLGQFMVRKLATSARRRLERLRSPDFDWRVGWRHVDGPDLFDLRQHPAGGWTDLPDDGLRFYADPFPIEHAGRVYLFVEEYPFATRKGIISVLPFDARGPAGSVEPVLDLPHHLSYPFVFARDGEFWMVPESSAARSIDLFRATRFPGGWVHEETLVTGVAASDATLVEHGGRWWMFATVKGEGGSYSDALHLWFAPDFRGPWTPHRKNPVLIDSASARPAGRFVERDGQLWRPVQDCRRVYGGALGLAQVLDLDPDRFAQRIIATVEPGPLWPGNQLHTVNRAGGFEFIDGSG